MACSEFAVESIFAGLELTGCMWQIKRRLRVFRFVMLPSH